MALSALSHEGRGPEIAMPMRARRVLNARQATMACRNMERDLAKSDEPIRWAIWTENPVAQADRIPQKSHVDVETRPMAADASAPRLPTIDASMYCMAMAEIWATIAGKLKSAVS